MSWSFHQTAILKAVCYVYKRSQSVPFKSWSSVNKLGHLSVPLIWRSSNDYNLFSLKIQAYLTAHLPLHGTGLVPAAALVPRRRPGDPRGNSAAKPSFKIRILLKGTHFFVFANTLCSCVQECIYIMFPRKFFMFSVNETYLLADRHFNCSSDESRSKHPDCVFLWGTSRGNEDANLKTVPLVKTILPNKHVCQEFSWHYKTMKTELKRVIPIYSKPKSKNINDKTVNSD